MKGNDQADQQKSKNDRLLQRYQLYNPNASHLLIKISCKTDSKQ